VLSTSPVQKAVGRHLVRLLRDKTGLNLEYSEFSYRIFPARLHLSNIVLSDQEQRSLSVETLNASWKWRNLTLSPPGLESLSIKGVVLDPAALPSIVMSSPTPQRASDPWETIRIENFQLGSGGIRAMTTAAEIELDDVRIRGFLKKQRLALNIDAASIRLRRDDRLLDLGVLSAEIGGDKPTIHISSLKNGSGALRMMLDAEISGLPPYQGHGKLKVTTDPAFLLRWWNPDWAASWPMEGTAEYSAEFSADSSGLFVTTHQEAGSFGLKGLKIHSSEFTWNKDILEGHASGPEWGRIQILFKPGNEIQLTTQLSHLDTGKILAFVPDLDIPPLFRETILSTDTAVVIPLPFDTRTISGKMTLEAENPHGMISVRGKVDQENLQIDEAHIVFGGIRAEGSGEMSLSGPVSLDGEINIESPKDLRQIFGRELPIDGGAISGRLTARGDFHRPDIQAEFFWERPRIAGTDFDRITAEITGPAEDPRWHVDAVGSTSRITASGTANPREPSLTGTWTVEEFSLAEIPGIETTPGTSENLQGFLNGSGELLLDNSSWSVSGKLEAREIRVSGIEIPLAEGDVLVGPSSGSVKGLRIHIASGEISGKAELSRDGTIGAGIVFSNIDPSQLFPGYSPARGRLSGSLDVDGTVEHPHARTLLTWESEGFLSGLTMDAELVDGRITLASETMESSTGPLVLRGDLPLGDFPGLHAYLPGAPGGVWKLNITGNSLQLAPLLSLAGHPDLPLTGIADTDIALQWHPAASLLPQIQAHVTRLMISTPVETFQTDGSLDFAFDGEEAVLGTTRIISTSSEISIGGSFDLSNRKLSFDLEGTLAPSLGRLSPIPVSIDQPIGISVHLGGDLDRPVGRLSLQHPGGKISLREPPIQIEDLTLEASYSDGALWVDDGHVRINGGRADLGGGWDRVSGQGLVAEFEKLSFLLPNDILTRWNGAISIEPSPTGMANIVGDVDLLRGLWDAPFDLGEAMRQDTGEPGGEAALAHEITLDIEVHGHGGIHVDNNLGQFDLKWNNLQVSGTAAEPRFLGDVNFMPGGYLSLPGKRVPIRRGMAQFTGDPLVDPLLEIVPDNSPAEVLGSPSSLTTEKEARGLAAAGISTGLSAFLGLANTSIRPEDIAADTETDTSTEFSIGQQLGQSTALFLTTDLRDSQRRTTLFQIWKLPYLPDLTIQLQSRTDTGESDLKLLKRFRWGGSRENDVRLKKVIWDGPWPVSRIRRRKALRLGPGQAWDPFLLFTARVRMEKLLTRMGYPEARVEARSDGDPANPIIRLSCTPGRKVDMTFETENLPRKTRRQARSLYRFPPMEEASFSEIRTLILRQYWADGYPDAHVDFEKMGEKIIVHGHRGEKILIEGPLIIGCPEEAQDELRRLISTPAERAAIRRDPTRAGGIVRRALAYSGYRSVEHTSVRIEKIDPGREQLVLEIKPGPRSSLTDIVLDGKDPLGILSSGQTGLKAGIPLDRRVLDRAISGIRKKYRQEGYTEVRARSTLEEISSGRWRLRLKLEPGEKAVLGEISLSGTRFLKEKYLRKGLTLHEGDLFLLEDLDESLGRISRFSPVERVDAEIRRLGENVVVDLNVEEKKRWTLEIGGGWNSDRGLALRLGFRDDNLFGRGLKAAVRTRWEKDFTQGRLILTLPPLPGGHFAIGLNSSYTEDYVAQESSADLLLKQNEGKLTLDATLQLKRGWFLRGYYRFTRTHVFEEDPIDPWFPVNIHLDLGTLGSQIIIDRLDDPFDPRSGSYLGLDLSWSGEALGSDTENIRSLLSASMAREPISGWTWFQSFRLGAAKPLDGVLDPSSRFFAGGPSTIRGFRRDSVGPWEVLGDEIIYVGGEALIILNEELRFPLHGPLRGAVFIDTGQVWENWSDIDGTLAVGAGLGLRWATPIGPLWGDVAWPVANRGSNSGPRFSFGIGRTF